jgi:hypothetical protein
MDQYTQLRTERDAALAEVARMQQRIDRLVTTLNDMLDELARPGDPTIDLTTFVIDTQTRVPVEPRHG